MQSLQYIAQYIVSPQSVNTFDNENYDDNDDDDDNVDDCGDNVLILMDFFRK